MQQRRVGATGLTVSRLGLGTMTWGSDDRRARGARPADRVRSRPAAPSLDTAHVYGDGASEELLGTLLGDVVARDEVVHRHQGRASALRRGRRRVRHLARQPAGQPRRVAAPPRRRPRRPVAGAHLGRRDAARGDAGRARHGGRDRPGVVRRDLELHRLADRPGRDLAARRARPDAAGRRPRWSTRCSTGAIEHEVLPAAAALGLGVLPWSPLGRGVLTGKYRTGTPSDSRGASRTSRASSSPTSTTAARGIVEAVARAADGLGWSALEVALTWVRDRPGVTAPIVGARTAAQLRGALGVEELSLPAEITAALDDVSAELREDARDEPCLAPPARPRGGVGVRQGDVLAGVLPQRGHQAARRARRARRLGAGPGPDRPGRHPPGDPAAQDHPAARPPDSCDAGLVTNRRSG